MMALLLLVFVGLPMLMFVLYVIGIQAERPTLFMPIRLVCLMFGVAALILDFILEWTVISVYLWQWPKEAGEGATKTEWTISDRLNRLCLENTTTGKVALVVSRILNYFAYGNNHIPNAVGR